MRLHLFNFLHEVRGFLETTIHTGETNVGHFINLSQSIHDLFADEFRRHFALKFNVYRLSNPLGEVFDDLGTDGTFLTGFADAGEKFVFGEIFAASIAFYDDESELLYLLIGGETMLACDTFPAAANSRTFAGSA